MEQATASCITTAPRTARNKRWTHGARSGTSWSGSSRRNRNPVSGEERRTALFSSLSATRKDRRGLRRLRVDGPATEGESDLFVASHRADQPLVAPVGMRAIHDEERPDRGRNPAKDSDHQ